MRKICILMLLLLLISGCSAARKEEVAVPETDPITEKEEVDVDLSLNSDTVIYASVINITDDPEGYMGKRIKLIGTYQKFYIEETDAYYHVCMVTDATACCSAGLEFKLLDEDAYPAVGREIILEGVLDTYMEGKYEYVYLKDATCKVY